MNRPRCHVTSHSLQRVRVRLCQLQLVNFVNACCRYTRGQWPTSKRITVRASEWCESRSISHQNWEVTGGGVGKWASSWPMLEKKSPVRLLPLMTGTLEGPIHPMSPKPITLRSLRSQSRGNLQTTTSSTDFQQRFHFTEPGHRYS